MRAGKAPLFRNVIVPWYDADTVCYSIMVLMVVILIFSIFGIAAAREVPAYRRYVWVPLLLAMMSAGVLASTIVRLVRRNTNRSSGL
jgi:hypothetical protein